MTEKVCFCGIDIGSSATKVVFIDQQKNICCHGLERTGIDFELAARNCFEQLMESNGIHSYQVAGVCATGYGRDNIEFANFRKTEIACHGKAAHHYCPKALVLIDIGGQDSKIIHLDQSGRRINFRMNRKCAAGTGAFLEDVANQLNMSIQKLNELALQADDYVTLGSFCTVFTRTEILGLIRKGEKIEDIARGIYDSITKRIVEMDPLEGHVVMTGGVAAHNSMVKDLLEEKIGKEILVPPLSQMAGAFGAALFAWEKSGGQNA